MYPSPLFTKGGEPEVHGERHKQSLTENMKGERNMLVKYGMVESAKLAGKEGIVPLRNEEIG
jgi:hypothetical protein